MCGSVSHRNSGFQWRWVPTPLVGAVRKNGGPKGVSTKNFNPRFWDFENF